MYNPLIRLKAFYCLFLILLSALFAMAQKPPVLSDAARMEFEKQYMNGAREKITGNTDEAIEAFKACIRIDPANDAVYYNLAELYLSKNQLNDAEEQIQKALAINKTNTWYWQLAEGIYETKRDFAKAAEICIRLSKSENRVMYLMRAAYCYEQLREFGKAISMLEQAEKITGINEEISMRKEQLYLAQNKLKKAIDEINRLSKAFPEIMRYKVLLAELYLINGKTAEGIAMYQDILKADPGNGYASFALGDYHHSIGENEKWYEYLQTGMAGSDVDIKSKLRMMVMFMSAGTFKDNLSRSHRLADIFIKTHPGEPSAYMIKGDLFVEEKQFRRAHEQYEQAVKLDASALSAWQQMMFCSSESGDFAQLQRDCGQALEVYPSDVNFYLYFTIASMQLKQYDTAVWSAKRGIEFSGEDLVVRSQFYANLGDAFYYLNDTTGSDSAFENSIRMDPGNAYAMNNYAYFLSLRKAQLEKAERMSKKSLELDPGNASYTDTYGWIMYQMKRYEDARIYIEKSLQLAPGSAEVLEHMGDIYYKLNQQDKAIEYWKQASEVNPASDKLKKKLKDGKTDE